MQDEPLLLALPVELQAAVTDQLGVAEIGALCAVARPFLTRLRGSPYAAARATLGRAACGFLLLDADRDAVRRVWLSRRRGSTDDPRDAAAARADAVAVLHLLWWLVAGERDRFVGVLRDHWWLWCATPEELDARTGMHFRRARNKSWTRRWTVVAPIGVAPGGILCFELNRETRLLPSDDVIVSRVLGQVLRPETHDGPAKAALQFLCQVPNAPPAVNWADAEVPCTLRELVAHTKGADRWHHAASGHAWAARPSVVFRHAANEGMLV